MATPTPSTGAAPVLKGRRPNPRVAQMKRTFYFLSRNTLAMIGLVVLIFFIALALWSFTYSAGSEQLDLYCGSFSPGNVGPPTTSGCIPVCTYPNNQPAPTANCYPVDYNNPGFVGPTFDITHLSGGPLPLGSLSPGGNSQYFYNIFAGLVKGAPWSLGISSGIVVSGAMIGLLLGSVAGFKGGLVDEIIMRITDIFLSIPGLLLILVLIAVLAQYVQTLEGRILLLMGAFIVTWWPFYTRIVRGQVLVTREQKFVEASKASGAKTGRLLFRHIIPNSMYPVFVQMSLDVGAIPLLLGALVYLGFHIFNTPYFPEWGSISALSVQVVSTTVQLCQISALTGTSCVFPWWQILFPGLTLFMFAISVNFLSDGLRDALDPRLRR